MKSSSKGYVSRPSGGLVNLPSAYKAAPKEKDMQRFALLFLAALAALLVFTLAPRAQEVAATTQVVGGNGGLVNLPGGGGVALTPTVGSFVPGQRLNAAAFIPVSYSVTSHSILVIGMYGEYVVMTKINSTGQVLYEATLTAIAPGITQIVSEWHCVCHPGVTQRVVTDSNGPLKPEQYQRQHDDKLAIALSHHPAKTTEQ